jgi:hypothetical protein
MNRDSVGDDCFIHGRNFLLMIGAELILKINFAAVGKAPIY